MAKKFKETEFYKDWGRIKEDLKPMSFWKKIDHLWYCYKVYILFFGFCFLSLGVLAGSFISYQSKNELVAGMTINLDMEQAGITYLTEDYEKYLGAGKKDYVSLELTEFGALDDPFNADDNYSRLLILISRVEGEMLDYALLSKSGLDAYVIYDVFLDLNEFFTEEEMAKFEAEGRVKYSQYEGDTEKRAIAVEITDIPFIQDNVNTEGPIYFALSGHNPDFEACRNAWDYLHAWESKAE